MKIHTRVRKRPRLKRWQISHGFSERALPFVVEDESLAENRILKQTEAAIYIALVINQVYWSRVAFGCCLRCKGKVKHTGHTVCIDTLPIGRRMNVAVKTTLPSELPGLDPIRDFFGEVQ